MGKWISFRAHTQHTSGYLTSKRQSEIGLSLDNRSIGSKQTQSQLSTVQM